MPEQQDSDAFLTLYTTTVQRIYAYLLVRVGHEQTAEDLTSQVWIKAWQSWPKLRHQYSAAWVFRIARTTLIDHYRHGPTIAWEGLEAAMSRTQPDRSADLAEVRRSLHRLTDEQRDIIVMRIWDGLTFAEIADILGSNEAACKMRYQRGIATLSSLLTVLTLFLYARP